MDNGGTKQSVYCDMGGQELCGSRGGWTRLAYLDMSDATQNCPSGFRLYQSGGVRACGRPVTNSGSCVSVQFPSNGISYSQVCGRVVGYQYGSPDAVYYGHGLNHNNLNCAYVDGVSITHGSPRQHVWTLMADNGAPNCPCASNSCLNHSLETITIVKQHRPVAVVIPHYTHLIHSGMVKVIILLKQLAVQLLVFHGFTEAMVTLPLVY